MSSRLLALCASTLVVLAWPAAAQAKPPQPQRFAAPGGAGTSCTIAAPCSVKTAIDGAGGVDEVILAPGSYGSPALPLTTPLSNGGFISVRGTAGEPMPQLFIDTAATPGDSYALELGGGSLADVAVTALGANDEGVLARSFDHVSVLVPTGPFACSPSLSMADTACIALGLGADALYDGGSEFPATPATLTLDHDTLSAPEGTAAYLWPQNFALTVAATDTIFAGGLGVGEYDIDASNHGTGSVKIDPSHDGYDENLNPKGLIPAGSYNTVETPPTFVNAVAGDVHEAGGSSTIDAGTQDDTGGDTDLAGGPRWIGAAQDIGAYEASESPNLIQFHAAHDSVDVQLAPNGADTTLTLQYGSTASYGSTVAVDAGASAGPVAETLPVAGLAPGASFHYRLTARNALGSAGSGDQTFTAADERFAAPGGLSTNPCTAAARCDLATAVNGAAEGQEVLLAPGSYGSAASPLATPLKNANDIAIEGEGATPQLFLATPGEYDLILNGFSRLAHVDITEAGAGDLGVLVEGTIDHALIVGDRSTNACAMFYGSALTDSACVELGAAGIALSASVSSATSQAQDLTLDHDTLFAESGATAAAEFGATGFPGEVAATDTIFRGPQDIRTYAAAAPASVTVTAAHSDYALVETVGQGSVTAPGSATDITAAPLFTSPATGDVHEAPGSPTIDAGGEDPFGGLTDLDGNPRTIGAAPDIGAYEVAEAPTVTASAAGAVTETTLSALASVNPNFSDTQVHVEYGTSTAYGSSAPAGDVGAGIAAAPISVALAGLEPGTVYHLRVVATNALGTTEGPDVTVTTASPAPLVKSPAVALRPGVLALPRSATVRGSVAQIVLVCTPTLSRGCRGRLRLVVYERKLARRRHRMTMVAVTVGTASFSLRGGQRQTIAVRLSAALLNSLRRARGHHLSVQLQVTRSDRGRSARRTLVLRRVVGRTVGRRR